MITNTSVHRAIPGTPVHLIRVLSEAGILFCGCLFFFLEPFFFLKWKVSWRLRRGPKAP